MKVTKKAEKRKILTSILGNLDAILKSRIKDNWAYKKTYEYYSSQAIKRTSFEKILYVLELYEESQDKNERITMEELSKKSGRSINLISRLYKELGLKKSRKDKIDEEDKKYILNGFKTNMNLSDIVYFTNANQTIVRDLAKTCRFTNQYYKRGNKWNYRLASIIYEKIDRGIKEEEILELVYASKERVRYILFNRNTIEDQIITALRTMFPDKEITKPYLN